MSPPLAEGSEPLLLNDAITVYFTADVQPVSVTGNTVTLVDDQDQVVPGTLSVGSNWVTFYPTPPVAADLSDGSFRAGARYRLQIAGSPRPDAVRAIDGRRLVAATELPVQIARPNERPPGLPALLRPPGDSMPFMRRPTDGTHQLPADAPRLYVHFTQPLLPASVTAEAFEVTLVKLPMETLVPRSVRVLPRPPFASRLLDAIPGCSVEIDLGPVPVRASGSAASALRKDDLVMVQLRGGAASVRDYSGAVPLPGDAQYWRVVEGSSLALSAWPAPGDTVTDDDGGPSFEVYPCPEGLRLRPRVRVEAGDGSLGVLRPQRDLTLRPGEPFDRGDGQVVVSRGSEFPFLAIDIPAGVTVRVAADGRPVQLMACGSVRIAGELVLACHPQRLPGGREAAVPVRDLAGQVPVAIVAAGDIGVRGRITATAPAGDDSTNLLLACAGAIDVGAAASALPFHTLLAVDGEPAGGRSIRGARGQSVFYSVTFTYGVAPGADLAVRGWLPWRQLPWDRDTAVVWSVDCGPSIQLGWQTQPADPVHRNEPDLTSGRRSRMQPVADREAIAFAAGSFVRFHLATRVRGGEVPPTLRELRVCDR